MRKYLKSGEFSIQTAQMALYRIDVCVLVYVAEPRKT